MANFSTVGVELVVRGASDFFGTLDKAGSKVAGFGKSIAKIAVAGTAAVAGFGAAIGGASIAAAVSFESAFAGVIKTTDGLVDNMGNLTAAGEEMQQGFRNLAKEVPTSVEELLKIGELGGQLGIAKENLIDFTRTIAAMGEATNLTTEEAATGFAQIANIMQTPQDEIENMGSSIVALGNNFATTERDILNFAQRIAGAGNIAGLTEAQVFGLGAAFSSVGIEAEAGGTAVQKVLLGMNEAVLKGGDNLEIFAATAGMSADDFATAWEADAGAAFTDFVNGLGVAGDDAITILSALGLEDQRLTRAFLSLAGSGDVLTDAMNLSTDAFAENTALTKEAEARYRTTESQFKILKNTIKDVAITIGQALLPFVNKMLKAAKPLIEEFGKRLPGFLNNVLVPAIETVTTWIGANLPGAIQNAANFWTSTLKPALEAIWNFITTSLIPAITQIYNWLSVNVPMAIQTVSAFWTGTLQPALAQVWAFIQQNVIPILQQLIDFLMTNVPPVVEEVSAFIQATFGQVVSWFQENMPLIMQTVQTVLTAISNFWAEHGAAIMGTVESIWNAIKSIISAAVDIVSGLIETALNIINGDWDAAWAAIKEVLNVAWEAIKTIIKTALEALTSTIIPAALDIIKNILNTALELWKRVIKDAWEIIKSIIQTALNTIKINIQNGLELIKTVIKNAWDAVKKVIKDVWDAIKGIVSDGAESILNVVKDIATKFYDAGKKQGIADAWEGLKSWFSDKLRDIGDMLPWNSPTRDPASPIHDLARAGRHIVTNLVEGMDGALRDLERAQVNVAATFGTAGIQRTAGAMSTAGGNVSMSNQFVFNTTMASGMDALQQQEMIRRTIQNAIRQGNV